MANRNENQKKILIITTVSGFLAQFELKNVSILKNMGCEIHYASNFEFPAYDVPCDFQAIGIHIHSISICKSPFSVWQNLKAYYEIREIVREEHITMIHCHNPMGGVLGRMVGIGMKNRPWVIYTAHGFHFYKGAPVKNWILYYTCERMLAHYTDCLITINHEDYEYAKCFRLSNRGFLTYIPGVGLDFEKLQQSSQGLTRKELGIPEDVLFILAVGEINQNKNHIAILEAMKELQDDSIYFGICGTGNLTYCKKLQDTASEYGLDEQFRLFGYKKNIFDFLQNADVFVFPSYREGFGMAALEAMAAGLPVISANNRGTREFMVDGYTGLMVEPDDYIGFAEAIFKMKDPVIRTRMGENCKKQAKKFSIKRTEMYMKDIYDQCERRSIGDGRK